MTLRRRMTPQPASGGGGEGTYAIGKFVVTDETVKTKVIGNINSSIGQCTLYIDDIEYPGGTTEVSLSSGEHTVRWEMDPEVHITNLSSAFSGLSCMREFYGNHLDVSYCTNFGYCFNNCSTMTICEMDEWNNAQSNGDVTMAGMVQGCVELTLIKVGHFKNVFNIENFASNSMKKCTGVDMTNVYGTITGNHANFAFCRQVFSNTNMTRILMPNLEFDNWQLHNFFAWGWSESLTEFRIKAFLPTAATDSYRSLFKNYNKLSHDSLINLLTALPDTTSLETAPTFELGSTLLGRLSADDKTIATNKGWLLT